MDRLISLEPSNIVPIRLETGRKCCGNLTLRNVMYTMPVGFKLQPNDKARYTVTPHSGIIPPLATLTVEIIYHLPLGSTLPESYPHCNDSFLLYSVVIPGAAVKDPSSTYDAVPNDWFTAKKKQVFIDRGVEVMFAGPSVLSRVVTDGSMDQIREVLERSDPTWKASDSVDARGQTLLHLAIAQSRPDIVQLLLEFEPNVEATSRSGSTPLEAAAASGEGLIVELLLAHHASTGRSKTSRWGPIHHASGNGHMEVLRLLLLKGADVDALTKDGKTALHVAVEAQRRDCLRLLLSSRANTDVRNFSNGNTPLHIAAGLGDEHMVNLLLQHGANKDIRNRLGKIAYDIAAENGRTRLFDVLRLGDRYCKAARKGELRLIHNLLHNGVSINARDQHGWTALHRASFKGKIDVVGSLLGKGIDVDAKDEDGYTALHCAVESGNLDVTELLIKKGADIDARTKKNVSALQIAESMAYEGIKRILTLGGANQEEMLNITYPFVNRTIARQESEAEGLKRKKPNSRKNHRGSFHRPHAHAVV